MNRVKGITGSLRLINSLVLTRSSATKTRSLHTQVTHFTSSPCLNQPISCNTSLFNQQCIRNFVSKCSSIVNFVSTKNWSDELKRNLEQHDKTLKHEAVMYVLKNLEKTPKKAYEFYNWLSGNLKDSIPVYCLMLRILAQKECVKEFKGLVKSFADVRRYIDKKTRDYIKDQVDIQIVGNDIVILKMFENCSGDVNVKSVVEAILESGRNDEVKKKLSKLEVSFTENFVVSVLCELREYPLKAFRFFRWVEVQKDYTHNAVTYNAMVWALGQNAGVHEFWSIVKEMKDVGYDIDIDTYAYVLKVFGGNNKIKDAVELYEVMMDSPYKPPVEDCSYLLDKISVSIRTNVNLEDRVLKKFSEGGYTLSVSEYDMIHKRPRKAGPLNEEEKELKPRGRAGKSRDKLDDAYDKYEKLEAQGAIPDFETRAKLILGFCRAGRMEIVLACITRLRLESNYNGDNDNAADVIKPLVMYLCSHTNSELGYSLIVMVKSFDIKPLKITYQHVIKKLLKQRKFEEALNLNQLAKRDYNYPFEALFIDYLYDKGTVDDAWTFLRTLSTKESKEIFHKLPKLIRKDPEFSGAFGAA